MSHSRILVIDNSEYDLEDMFEEMRSYGNGVDYINDTIETKQVDFDWFMNYVRSMGFVEGSEPMSFKVAFPQDFWNRMREDIDELIKREGGINEKNRFEFEDRLGMKRGFWIYIDGALCTLAYFIEFYGNKPEKEFKVTKILDYHM